MPIKSLQDLSVYQNAQAAIAPTKKVLDNFPSSERAKLVDQIWCAAQSVPANIAEGYGHKDKPDDFKRYLRIAMGSSNEVIARLETALRAGYIDKRTHQELTDMWTIVGKQLNKLIQNWRKL